MVIEVVDAAYRDGHRVWLKFSDGLEGEVDLGAELWGEVFEPLRDPAYFAAFRVDQTLTWPNGADFAPEFLHGLVQESLRTHANHGNDGRDAQARGGRPGTERQGPVKD